MADPLNDGADHPGVSGAQGNNAQAPDQQSAQTAVATPHAQGNSSGTLESLTALNLKPEKTIYMLKQTEAILRETQVDRQTCKAHKKSPKFKATSVPFNVLRIGKYEARPQYPSNLIAKWHYSNKRLIWEILENFVMKKIEISWSDISAIRVVYGGNVEILEVELSKPPHFYCETEMRPKKHTSWKPSSDFTDGQACTYRRHHLEFPQGKLEKNMEQLFLSDSRLRELTRSPFPSSRSPLFEGYISDAPQTAPHFMNPELVQLPHHLHHPLPPSHSSVSMCLPNDELMVLIQEYERRSKNDQVLSPGNSLTSQVSDYGYAIPQSLPRYGTIFDGQFMGHLTREQIGAPSSYNCGGVTFGTTHGHHGYDYNSNATNMMMASNVTSTLAGMNIVRHAPQSIFNQDMGRCHSGPGSSSNAPAIDMPSSSCVYPTINDHASQGSHERFNNNNEPLMNEIGPHHAYAQDRLIYPELVSNYDHHHHRDHQFMANYNTPHFLPSEYMMNVDEVRNLSCFRDDKPPHFLP